MLDAVNDARARKEFAWAAQLVQHLHLVAPADPEVRQLKAGVLRELAYRTTGFAPRSFLLSEARELEGATRIPALVAPTAEVIAAAPDTYVDYFRIRIDPELAQDTEAVLRFSFTDAAHVALHIRRGIAEFVADPDGHYRPADVAITMSPEAWARVYLGTTGIEDGLSSGEVTVTIGDPATLSMLMSLFDPLHSDQGED